LDPLVHASGYSFPSGHSFSSFTFFGLMAYLIWQTDIGKGWKIFLSILFFLLASVIATSRVYLHVHYASDVLGGFSLSMLWLILSLYTLHKLDLKLFQ
jgi:undecaprenyl-diphosphatase